jgi:hypothetical protein
VFENRELRRLFEPKSEEVTYRPGSVTGGSFVIMVFMNSPRSTEEKTPTRIYLPWVQ